MNLLKGNLLNEPVANKFDGESLEPLVTGGNVSIERIITNESFTVPGPWYDQDKDELVVLIQGKAELEFENNEISELNHGDYLLIPAHKVHRVWSVSKSPNCIWLAIHANFK